MDRFDVMMLGGAMFAAGVFVGGLIAYFLYRVEESRRVKAVSEQLKKAVAAKEMWKEQALKKGSKALQNRHDEVISVLTLIARQSDSDALPATKLRIVIAAARTTLDAIGVNWQE